MYNTEYSSYNQLNRYRQAKGRVKACIYARISTDEQKKSGYSIRDQLDYGYIFAKENDLIVTGEYVDEGISATLEISKRKALAQLLEDAKKGKFDIIIIKCLDRFFRNVEEFYVAQKILRKAGVTWLSIEEADLDPEDTDASFKINIYLTMAEYEARKTAKRIRFNNKMRIQNKQVVTGDQCFFFPWTVVGDPRNRHLARNMEEADSLYDILDYYEMHQSKAKTLEYYNTKYNKAMSYYSFSKLLQDTLLYGEYKGTPNYVEPYISKERYDRIQDILKRNVRYPKEANYSFLFSGMINCYDCGWKLNGNRQHYGQKRKTSQIYRCAKHFRDKCCSNNHTISEFKIEDQLLEMIEQCMKDEIVKVESIKESDKVAINNTKKIEAIKKEMDKLNKMYRRDNIDEEEYYKETDKLKIKLKKLEDMEKPVERDLSKIKALLETDFKTMYEALDNEHKRAFWRGLIKEFTIGEDRKVIPESIIFF